MSKIKTIIAALLAKARSTDNEHEAATFLAKAHELLEKHQIDMGELADADDPVRHDRGLDSKGKWMPSWHRHLYRALGHLYGCESVRVTMGGSHWRQELVGRESSIVTVEAMFPYIVTECNRLGREIAKGTGETGAYEARRVGNALEGRIWQLVRANKPKDNAPRTPSVANALVTIDRVQQVLAAHYGDLSKGKSTHRSTNANAREAAAGIGLHRQTGGSSTLRLA